MNINKLLETIKDTSRDYVGINGCLYQDISREELDLIVNEIERLNNRIYKAIEYIENNSLYEEEYDYDYEEIMYLVGTSDEVAKNDLLSILKGSDK